MFIYIGIPNIYVKYIGILLKKRANALRGFVLTFDDGPGRKLTPDILKVLDEHNIKGTFFLLGRNIKGSEEIIKKTAEKGHEICSHGFDHLNYMKVSPIKSLRDIKKGWESIDSALETNRGKYPFRPPYGKLNIVCLLYLLVKRVPIIYWTDDSGDTWKHRPDSERIANIAKDSNGLVPLFHDFDRSDEKVGFWVHDAVCSAIDVAKQKGMRMMTISELS